MTELLLLGLVLLMISNKTAAALDFTSSTYAALQRAGLSGEGLFVALGQAAYESGFGGTQQALEGFNVFNLAAGTDEAPASQAVWPGAVLVGNDTEVKADGTVVPIHQRWRVYPNIDAAVADWSSLLQRLYPDAWSGLQSGDVSAYVQGLQNGVGGRRYFTQNTAEYLSNLSGLVDQVKAAVAS